MANTRQAWTDTINRRELTAKRAKYGAVKVTVDGIVFDSKREAARYHELKLMEKAGKISALETQPEFRLNTWHGDHGYAPYVGSYIADFRYWSEGNVIVEDVKGFKTPLYRWKKKHVEAQYGIQIREV